MGPRFAFYPSHMIARWLTALSFLCFGLLSLFVVEMTKRPLCIDSKVVERVDRLYAKGSDTVYRCAVNKETEFNTYFNERSRDLGTRLQKAERLLESIEPFQRKVQLTIFEDRPLLFRVQGHHIYMGQEILDAPGHLEKALAKIWFRERNEVLFAQQALMEEVMTDFLLYLDLGDLDIGDPGTKIKTALRKVKWPYVLKSVASYCESPWKKSEHYVACKTKEGQESIEDQVIEMSLRPLIVHSWVRAYTLLPFRERLLFSKSLPLLLRAEHTQMLPLVNAEDISQPTTALGKAAMAITNMNHYVSKSMKVKDSETHRLFVSNFTNEIRANGFDNAFAEANFDILFVLQKDLPENDKTLSEFLKLAKANPNLQMAIQSEKNLWMLPSKYPIPLESFGIIKANRTVVEKCGGYNFSYVMDYADTTEKLLVVDHCEKQKDLAYAGFLKDGAEGFGVENKGAAFVQFHLPSLLMRRTELSTVSNVFEFIQRRDVESPSFKSLGWSEVHWSEQAKAYKPKAFVDAIEWFRVPN